MHKWRLLDSAMLKSSQLDDCLVETGFWLMHIVEKLANKKADPAMAYRIGVLSLDERIGLVFFFLFVS